MSNRENDTTHMSKANNHIDYIEFPAKSIEELNKVS
jgi:hypothetical protein